MKNGNFFVKQNHKNVKVAFIILYVFLFIVITFGMIENAQYRWWGAVSLFAILILFVYLIKLFGSYGVYVIDGKVYYQTAKRKEVDINRIMGIKIIKSEAQVNLAWSPFTMKDNQGNTLYSMICLSKIEEDMVEYPYGDIEFLRKYKKNVIMYSVYDEKLIDFLKKRIANVKIISTHG